MKLSLVSNFFDIPHEHFALNLMLCEGLDTFHLRKKDYCEEKMRAYIERIPSHFHSQIILHSHFHIVEEYGLKGAHFTKKFTYEEYQEQNIKLALDNVSFERMGFSFHSINEVETKGTAYDYVFLSPIFDSISNKGYNSKFKPTELRNFLHLDSGRPEIIALGGINESKVSMACQMGFDGIALLGHIWTNFEMDHDVVEVVNKFIRMQRLVEKCGMEEVVRPDESKSLLKANQPLARP